MATTGEMTEKYETLNCPVCLTKFENPRILPCLHTICEKCLRGNIESDGQSSTQFMCPICRTPTVSPDSGLSVDKWISELMPDSIMKSLVDKTENSVNIDDRCDPCKREGESTRAEIGCLGCKEKLCGPCVKYHKRFNVSAQHAMVPVSEYIEKNISGDYERSCVRHPGKPLELFCVDHRELCCVLCFASNHRECNNIRGIDDVVKQHPKGFANKILEELIGIRTEISKIMTDENVVQLVQDKENTIKDMNVTVDKIIAKLNELRKSFQDEAGPLYEDGKFSLLKHHKVIQGFLTNINNSYRILVNVSVHGSLPQKFIMFETTRSQIISHHQQLKIDLKDNVNVLLTVKPNKVLQDIERSLDDLDAAEVTLNKNTVVEDSLKNIDGNIKRLNSCTQLSTPMCAAQVEKSDMMTSSVTLVKTVTQQNLGKVTHITGGAFLGDGRLVMADYNNRRLLQLNDDYNIVREHKMDGRPIDVAAGNNQNEIYISLSSDDFYICRCSLETSQTITRKITAPWLTCGIAVIDETTIAVAPYAVSLISQDGSTVKSLPTSRGDSYVAVSQSLPSLYYGERHSVVSRTLDGKELFQYNNDNLKTVRGICVHNNNVYVCGTDSHNVHQISSDGQNSRVLLDKLHSISRPRAVVFNEKKNEIIISSNSEDTVLEVYKWR